MEAGPRVAAIPSALESCLRLGIPVREYRCEVLPGWADRKASEGGADADGVVAPAPGLAWGAGQPQG